MSGIRHTDLLGAKLTKTFPDFGDFRGEVVAVDRDVKAKKRMYTVLYEDGDKEDLYLDELRPLLDNPKEPREPKHPSQRRNTANEAMAPARKRTKVDPVVVQQRQVEEILAGLPEPATPLPASSFHFFIISKGRSDNVGQMQATFQDCPSDVTVSWVVGEGEEATYRAAGARHVLVGGGLCASRNLALDTAAAENRVCVQMSDDLSTFKYVDCRFDRAKVWKKPTDQTAANLRAKQATERSITPLGAAQVLEETLRRDNLKLAGGYCNQNQGYACRMERVTTEHFLVGDFLVVDCRRSDDEGIATQMAQAVRASGFSEPKGEVPPRFDLHMRLKEDYDFTAQHLRLFGGAARNNRLFVKAEHYVNAGGAVDVRCKSLEKKMVKHLKLKWPGVFHDQRRPNEVIMKWAMRKPYIGDRTAKYCKGGCHMGEVTKFLAPADISAPVLWLVTHDDGETEHMTEEDVCQCRELRQKIDAGELPKVQRKPKRKRSEAAAAAAASDSSDFE